MYGINIIQHLIKERSGTYKKGEIGRDHKKMDSKKSGGSPASQEQKKQQVKYWSKNKMQRAWRNFNI